MSNKPGQSTSVPPGIAGLIAYFVPLFGGLLFLFLEKQSTLIRFHAVQSILLWVFFIVVSAVFGWIPGINVLVWIFIVVVWVFIMYQALMERSFELPLIGPIARRQVFGDGGPPSPNGE